MMQPQKIAGPAVCLTALFMMGRFMTALAENSDLYQARTIVTGQNVESHGSAIALCLRDVLVKVSGDPRLGDDARVEILADNARELADKFEYLDRMAGIQIHDEQGSRDRSFYLTVSFNPEKIDTVLKTLGRAPWRQTRPRLTVFVAIKNNEVTYALAEDGIRGRDQRDSLAEAAWQMGMRFVLPNEAMIERLGVSFPSLPEGDPVPLQQAAKRIGGDVALAGHLEWNKGALGWIAKWRLHSRGKDYRWQIREVSFDNAFRSGMSGAAQVLSGNGSP
jgi:hypothetical protein